MPTRSHLSLALLGAFGSLALPATAAVLTVTTDTTLIAEDGLCSLPEALYNANHDAADHPDCAAGAGADTIDLPAEAVITVEQPVGWVLALPAIASELTINGHGATVQRSGAPGTPPMRLLHLQPPADHVVVNDLTLANGYLEADAAAGIAIIGEQEDPALPWLRVHVELNRVTVRDNTLASGLGAGIYNYGHLVMNDSRVSGNRIVPHPTMAADAQLGRGAGIFNSLGVLELHGVAVHDNSSCCGSGAGIYNSGGTTAEIPDHTALVTIDHSLISGNSVHYQGIGEVANGGGITNISWADASGAKGTARMVIDDSVVSDNHIVNEVPAPSSTGGGIFNGNVSSATIGNSIIEINRSTISGNSAAGSGELAGAGGGLVNVNAQATLVNSTVSGNRALGTGGTLSGFGGGIVNFGEATQSRVTLISTTITANDSTDRGGGIANGRTGGKAMVEMRNSIIAGNTAGSANNCASILGTFISRGYNLEDSNQCGLKQATDLQNTTALLGPLADNGGPTPTHALLAGSFAIDNGDDAVCADATVGGVDQRGEARPQGMGCDIGAYERAANDMPECDLNSDGEFDRKDKLRFLRTCRGSAESPCDRNGDGKFSGADVVSFVRGCRVR